MNLSVLAFICVLTLTHGLDVFPLRLMMLLKMKLTLVVLICAFTCSYGTNEVTPKLGLNLSKKLKSSIECLQTSLKDGVPEIGLPSFDPLLISNAKIDLSALNVPFLKGSLRLYDFKAEDVPNWELTNAVLNFPLFGKAVFDLTLDWPSISMVGNYDLNGSFLGVTFTGTGKIQGSAESGTFHVEAVKPKLLPPSVEGIIIKPKISSAGITIDQFYIGSVDKTKEMNETFKVVIDWFLERLELFADKLSAYLSDILTNRNISLYVNISNIINELIGRCVKLI